MTQFQKVGLIKLEVKQKDEYEKKAEDFNKKMSTDYSKEQIDFLFGIIKKIIHYHYNDEQSLNMVSIKVKFLLKEIVDGLQEDKKRFLSADSYIRSRLDDDLDDMSDSRKTVFKS